VGSARKIIEILRDDPGYPSTKSGRVERVPRRRHDDARPGQRERERGEREEREKREEREERERERRERERERERERAPRETSLDETRRKE